jgi:SAM-dependent methyltransferase
MTGWDDGYVSDVVYTRNAYRETTPIWLATAALLCGQRPPELDKPFRYADLGCGHGLTATMVAATYPHAEVWAFDFNPAHVASGRHLASKAGLTNLHFQEASFAELAALPQNGLPEFDFIVAHGVVSWVSAENRAKLIQIIGQRLRAGGLAYLSYAAMTGWASMMPARALMRMRASRERSDQAATGLFDYLDLVKGAGAKFFADNPATELRLNESRNQDPRYIAHEYLNSNWQPLMFAEMADAMATVKCTYIGSATLTENLDALSVSPAMVKLLADTSDPILRETLRDFGIAQPFRRDVYRRGTLPLMGPERARLWDEVELVWTGRELESPILLDTPLGKVDGPAEIYQPLMQMFIAENQTVGALRQSGIFTKPATSALTQAVSLLISGGYVYPALPLAVRPAGRSSTDRLNAAIGAFNMGGGDITRLAASTIGSEIGVDPLETLMVLEKLSGRPMELAALTERVVTALAHAGRAVRLNGKPVQDAGQAGAIIRESLGWILEQRFPVLARLGVISG